MRPLILEGDTMSMNNLYKVGLYKYIRGGSSGRAKKSDLIDMYMNLITLIAAAGHDYKTPDFNKYNYESAINTGVAAFYRCPVKSSVNYNKWCCTPAKVAGQVNNMCLSKKITTSGSDYSLNMEVDKDCILIYNNSAMFPDYIFTAYAEQLTETDVTMDKLIKWARMNPIPKAKTNEDIAKFTTAMQRILDGDDITVLSDDLAAFTDGHATIDDNVLRLTDESAIDKMHFIDEHHEQLVRRLATLGGLPFSTTAKSAQNLTDELHDMDALATFIINDRAACRRDGFERAAAFMKEKAGIDFDFEYKLSDVLAKQQQLANISYDQEKAAAEKTEAEAEKTAAEAEKAEAETESIEKGDAENESTEAEDNDREPDAAAGDTVQPE